MRRNVNVAYVPIFIALAVFGLVLGAVVAAVV